MGEKYIPVKVLEMCVLMINAADQCDQCGSYDRDLRWACQRIIEWSSTPDYRLTFERAKAVEAEPVRHGRWINIEKNGVSSYSVCSECGAMMNLPWYWYCGKCGARMFGGADNG